MFLDVITLRKRKNIGPIIKNRSNRERRKKELQVTCNSFNKAEGLYLHAYNMKALISSLFL